MRPTRGQVWRFNDGTEGVIASSNSMSVAVYVGPVGYMIPIGDVDLVFGHATCVDLGSMVYNAKTPVFVPVFKDPENVTQAEMSEAIAAEPATTQSRVTIVAEPKPSRRGANRKRNTEVK